MNKDDNQNDIDKMKIDYFNIEVPLELDGYIESSIRRAKISRRNRYIAPLTVIAICAVIMVCLGFVKPRYIDGDKIGMNSSNAAKHEQLPVVGSLDNLKKLLASNITIGGLDSIYNSGMGSSKGITLGRGLTEGQDTLSAKDSTNSAQADYSTTNVQVQGVDEGDTVKTDGKYMYRVNNDRVVIIDCYPAEDMKVICEKSFSDEQFRPRELFLNGKYMVVIGNGVGICNESDKGNTDYLLSTEDAKAIVYDISDKKNPKEVRSFQVQGKYISSRVIDSKLYLATSKYIGMYKTSNGFKYGNYIPSYKDSLGGNIEKNIDYNKIQYCPEAVVPNYIMVSSLDLKKLDKAVQVTTILGSAGNMYVSDKNLYVAGTKYDKNTEETYIYKFALKDGATEFVAKGNVPGHILNQYSMDESKKYFRIATTNGAGSFVGSEQKNNLYILDENMKVKGKLEGMAPGEKIYSTRFVGDRAYMVTFKNTDPLFVMDLKDPENPKILGELKIPGFSNYLLPYDENHIIGFGKDTEEVPYSVNGGNQSLSIAITKGMKLAMFDVTDVNNPKQQFVTSIGGRGTSSDILNNPKALLFNKDKGLLAFPIYVTKESQGMSYGAFDFQGLYVYNVNLKDGFALKGRIDHSDFDPKMYQNQNGYGDYSVQRALYINDTLYTLSNGGIKANNLEDLKEIGKLKTIK